ncbi:MAG: 3-deoxy-manno-octulosonate cytidylyltransferase [Anaerolineae bacterium]|nr:3-deoxy-manno-octulosonate cytidylyltransferase [Anaerolineae bacterium]
MASIAIIPARLGSTRLPRKVLADIHGHPLIWHVWSRAKQARRFNEVYVATDADEVRTAVESWGGKVLMTSMECRSGTERLAECLDRVSADLIVNVQGDEPLIDHKMLDALVTKWEAQPSDLITPVFRITSQEELTASTVVKVARARSGEALYFSRSTIPFMRDWPQSEWLGKAEFWGHIGVYGYRRDVLAAYPNLPVSPLETSEQLEQLRFLDAGYRFQTLETDYRSIAVDIDSDLDRVRILISPQA